MVDVTYIINLDRSPQRWRHVQDIVSRAAFTNVQRIAGIDGSALHEGDIVERQEHGELARDLSAFNTKVLAGVNRPPEYWPADMLERIDEAEPFAASRRFRKLVPRFVGRMRRLVGLSRA
ncbi:MAG: hypothetical protein ACO1Q7_01820 [Gemmatimonas sp.]